MLYSRSQLWLLLALSAALLVGLGVREWRAGFPAEAERLERFDRDEAPAPLPPLPVPAIPRRPAAPRPHAPAPGSPATPLARGPAPPGEKHGIHPRGGPGAPAPTDADPRPLDLNQASLDQLARLPGIGPGLAGRIVAERMRRGGFSSPEALRQVLGLGPKKLAAVRDLVTTGEASPGD